MEDSATIDWYEIDRIMQGYHADRTSLLMILQDICDLYNYPPQVVPLLAERLGVKESLIYSVATFYKSISLEPQGKYIISVCTGTACHVRGAEKVMRQSKTSPISRKARLPMTSFLPCRPFGTWGVAHLDQCLC